MSCHYCAELARYDLLPAEERIAKVTTYVKDGDAPVHKKVETLTKMLAHGARNPLSAQPDFFIPCGGDES